VTIRQRDTSRSRGVSERIALAAHDLFLSQGFAQTSMDAIASRAGVSKATLYARFASKDRLFTTVIGDLLRQSWAALVGTLGEAPAQDRRDAILALKEVCNRLLRYFVSPAFVTMARAVISEIGQFPELGRAMFESANDELVRRLAPAMRGLAARKLLAAPDPDLAARQLIALLKTDLFLRRLLVPEAPIGDTDIARNVDAALLLFLQQT